MDNFQQQPALEVFWIIFAHTNQRKMLQNYLDGWFSTVYHQHHNHWLRRWTEMEFCCIKL